ncbi:membrane integrity-associated transporter subunit PqiC [Candidatus Pantoea edessiphila]|uniref:membrane integrity-associated transporter subunit PqiC n=1 Tax=Candidatus Pantoea edessiphila TaxID=2044610 RepID=UPI001319E13C|nr:membrane integrity-associated transporter subunit PqiC [Candidatus Pantoea edessiphila]
MKKEAIILVIALLTACSGSSKKTYYHLPLETNHIHTISNKYHNNQPVLWIQQILLPDHLAGNGLVYQTNDVEYVITNHNLWINPLVQQLKQTMISNLSDNLPEWFISADIPMIKDKISKLNIIMKKFQGRYDGKVIISGEWLLEHGKYFIKRDFSFIIPQKKDGYDELVYTLSLGWHKVSDQISKEIINLNPMKQ